MTETTEMENSEPAKIVKIFRNLTIISCFIVIFVFLFLNTSCIILLPMIYNLYIFDKGGKLIFYSEWNRQKQSGLSMDNEAKLMSGMLFSIKTFVTKLSPYDIKQGFLCYRTDKYALHYLETPTGLKFVLNTDVNAQKVREILQQLYSNVYVNYVVRNPICDLQDTIKSELFKTKLDSYIKQTAIYSSK